MDIYFILLIIGGLFVLGLAADEIGRRTRLPRVTLIMLVGVLAGPMALNIVPTEVNGWYDLLSSIALTMVAFLLGGSLSREQLKRHGKPILAMSVAVVVVTILVVSVGLIAIGTPPILALLLAGVATATDPAATMDVIKQRGRKGDFAETLEGIVAIDDVWGLISFSLVLIGANILAENGISITIQEGLWEFVGAVGVGAVVGFPAAYLTGHLRKGEPIQTEALAVVFLCAGLSHWLGVSILLSGIVAGAIVVNFAKHHTHAFHEIENIEWPFMIVFFFLAGASLHFTQGWAFAALIAAYCILRTASRVIGGWIGGQWSRSPASHNTWMGAALLPQAGIAIGMALVAGHNFPELKDILLAVTVLTTVIFELIGPLATQIALDKVDSTDSRQRVAQGEEI